MSAPYFYKIWSTNPSRIIPRSSAAIWGSSKLLLSDLAAKVDDYLENSIPPAAKWIPDRSDDINLIWTANLHWYASSNPVDSALNLRPDMDHALHGEIP